MRTILGVVLACILSPAWGAAPPSVAVPAAATGKPPVAATARANDKTYEQLSLLVDVLNLIQDSYVDDTDAQKLIYGAAGGMVRTLDPFSQFMEPEAHREITAETEGQFGGIGVRLYMKDDWLTVLTPMPGTPAYRAGLLPGDRIVAIDGESAKDLQVADAMDRLRGAAGTKLKIGVQRWAEPAEAAAAERGRDEVDEDGQSMEEPGTRKDFELVRDSIKIESVRQRRMEDQIGYLRISEFSGHTVADFHDAMRVLTKGGLAGLVLDLRFNPGGLLTAAVDVASSFLGGNKLIVYTQGRRAATRQEFRGGAQAPYQDLPLVVLINESSASGAEIVAGALQDHRRAVLMGARTYGKASVQSVVPLPDNSALRLTVARYYTPSGRSIHRDEKKKTGGITPDIAVPAGRDVNEKLFAQWELVYEPGKKPRSAAKSSDIVRDEALERAVALLKARGVLGCLKGKDN